MASLLTLRARFFLLQHSCHHHDHNQDHHDHDHHINHHDHHHRDHHHDDKQVLPELPLTQEEALRFQEENLAAAVSINILTMAMAMITTMMMMIVMTVMMTMMIQVVGVSQSKKSSRVQSRVGSLAPSRSQNVIIIMAMILMIRRKQLIPVTRVSDVVKGENDLLQTYCGNRNAQARLHGSFEGSIPRWKQDG